MRRRANLSSACRAMRSRECDAHSSPARANGDEDHRGASQGDTKTRVVRTKRRVTDELKIASSQATWSVPASSAVDRFSPLILIRSDDHAAERRPSFEFFPIERDLMLFQRCTGSATTALRCVKTTGAPFRGVPSPDRPSGAMILDEYVFLKRLGEGAFATVWAARKRVGDDRRKLYAVKHLKQSDDSSSRKNRLTTPEFRSLKAIPRCPHVLRAVQVARERGEVFLVTEWCDTDLLKLIERARERGLRALPEPVVASAVRHLLVALEHCHKSGWTHRDVKPENMLIADGVAKLADWWRRPSSAPPTPASRTAARDGTALPSSSSATPRRRRETPAPAQHARSGPRDASPAECFLGHALFRGASSPDMLDKIAETLGRGGDEEPPEDERAWISRSGRGDAPRGPGRLDALLANGRVPDARSLCWRHMLRADPSRRVSAAKALRHPFLARADPRDRVELPDGAGPTDPRPGPRGPRGPGASRRGAIANGDGGVVLGAKAAARAEALRREREAAADSQMTSSSSTPCRRRAGARGCRGTPRRGPAADDIADAAPAAVDGRSDEGSIPDEPTAEAEAAMAEIRRRMEARGRARAGRDRAGRRAGGRARGRGRRRLRRSARPRPRPRPRRRAWTASPRVFAR